MVDGLQVVEDWRRRQWQRVLRLDAAFGHVAGKKGVVGFGKGCRRGGELLAAIRGTVDVARQRLSMATGQWSRAREGGGSGISVRST
ncbi:hypothetical protein B296_00007506 [Ensete ventricosum]|uniref:Uncharacterized protein n=1 Tax=Ensete ventricosum TaxID=4639 RepID=A0A426XN12_ENSVE|nr:hypothetical protein B296_00007506 [Ensete ventricosum]